MSFNNKLNMMNKIRIFLWLFAIVCLFSACEGGKQKGSNKHRREESKFITYQMPDDLLATQKELTLSELADSVWYVPLETTTQCILAEKFDHFRYKDSTFYVMDDYSKTVYVFSDKGKFLRNIGNKGNGPKEFHWCHQLVIDNEYLYILDMPNRIKKYDLEGNWIKDIKLTKQPYRLLALKDGRLAAYISDDQFPKKEDAYSWMVLDTEGDSLTCIDTNAWREKKPMQNYWVENEFSSQYSTTYKEAYNDSLYYFPSGSLKPVPYASIHPGIHRLESELSWEEIPDIAHGLRISYIYDTPRYLFFTYKCMCTSSKQNNPLLGAFLKETGEFFNVFDKHGEQKITNDLDGPDFTLLASVYPNLLIGLASADTCPDEFAKKHQVEEDDNQVLVMIECKN